jgi:hypothetical protein
MFNDSKSKQTFIVLRGHRVILDENLAELYEVEVKVLNQAVKRNSERFPEDFMWASGPLGTVLDFVTLAVKIRARRRERLNWIEISRDRPAARVFCVRMNSLGSMVRHEKSGRP